MARQVGAGLPGALKVMGRKDACDFPSCAGCVWEWGGEEKARSQIARLWCEAETLPSGHIWFFIAPISSNLHRGQLTTRAPRLAQS